MIPLLSVSALLSCDCPICVLWVRNVMSTGKGTVVCPFVPGFASIGLSLYPEKRLKQELTFVSVSPFVQGFSATKVI